MNFMMYQFYTHYVSRYVRISVTALLLNLLLTTSSKAQCPGVISASTTVTPAICPSNGTITVNSNAGATATYQIISGPAGGGYQTTSQSSNIFNGLPPGSYTIEITCGSLQKTVTDIVADQYTPLTLNTTVSNVCTSQIPGGTITATATGGNPSLSYAFLQSTNPAEPDANFTYSSSNTFTTTVFGTYQVRVKDACNNFITKTVQVAPLYPLGHLGFIPGAHTCTQNNYTGTLTQATNGFPIDYVQNPGYSYEIYQLTAGSPCTIPSGLTPIITKNITQSSDLLFSIPVSVPRIAIKTISPCGESITECFNIAARNLTMSDGLILHCPTSGTVPSLVDLLLWADGNFTWPVTVNVTPLGGSSIIRNASNNNQLNVLFYNIPYASQYTYTATDACGVSVTKTITTPVATDNTSIVVVDSYLDCVNTIGSKRVQLFIRGYNPGADHFSATILNSLNNVVYTLPNGLDGYIFTDPLPPGNYTIHFIPTNSTASCPPRDIPFTISSGGQPTLAFSLSATTTQFCGGAGSINASLNYNGGKPVHFDLLDALGTVISTNLTGTFINLPAGNYTVRATADYSSCSISNLVATKQLTILAAGADPAIIKKIGINCDNNPGTAIASFEISGVGPFLLEMKKSTDLIFSPVTNNAPATYTATGLDANTTYDVRITDNCGNTSVTQVSTQNLAKVALVSTHQPCVGNPYTLSVEQLPGAAYSWTFNGGSTPISTSSEINFGAYTVANDGTYECTITLGSCVTRTVTIKLNSNACGIILPVTLIKFTAETQGSQVLLKWQTASEEKFSHFIVEYSANKIDYIKAGTIEGKNIAEGSSYNFIYTPTCGNGYYRLAEVDVDGKISYSKTISAKISCNNKQIILSPNPTRGMMQIEGLQSGQIIQLHNTNGQLITEKKIISTHEYLDLSKLQAGVYYVTIKNHNENLLRSKVIKVD